MGVCQLHLLRQKCRELKEMHQRNSHDEPTQPTQDNKVNIMNITSTQVLLFCSVNNASQSDLFLVYFEYQCSEQRIIVCLDFVLLNPKFISGVVA